MKKSPATRAVHGRRDPQHLSSAYPIYQSASFAVENSDEYDRYLRGEEEFYIYSRQHNPTVRNVEEKLAALENAEDGALFASGMAAITSAILSVVKAGSAIAAPRQLFGTTFRFLNNVLPRFGVATEFFDDEALYDLHHHAPEARLVYFETPINPHCRCLSIEQVVAAARETGAVTIMDNTFASPVNQNPLDYGVDMVVHSATKYIGGHGDIIAGAVAGSRAHMKAVRDQRTMFGGCINAQDAFLLDRSLKTLEMRVKQQNANAQALAEFFADERRVQRVYYPGLPDSPGHAVAKKQMRGFGGMLCVELESLEAAKIFCDALEVGLNATSLGSVETLVSIPVLTSHAFMDDDELRAAAVTPGMVRISAGVEAVEDLIADFRQALARIPDAAHVPH
jgi:cystathionine beta-lyase/cystathionine gamma-synthase